MDELLDIITVEVEADVGESNGGKDVVREYVVHIHRRAGECHRDGERVASRTVRAIVPGPVVHLFEVDIAYIDSTSRTLRSLAPSIGRRRVRWQSANLTVLLLVVEGAVGLQRADKGD